MSIGWVEADWDAPDTILAGTTTRSGGVSVGGYASLNLGTHVGDDPRAVHENRRRLQRSLRLESEPLWLDQKHGIEIADARRQFDDPPTADASISSESGQALVIMSADCLPVLFSSRDGQHIGAAHGGWRGLAAGILERTVDAMPVPPGELIAWLGPAISQDAFEVGDEVRTAFTATDEALAAAFRQNERGRWQADLYGIARRKLQRAGVFSVSGGSLCTHSDGNFFSHRRAAPSGRMASLILRRP